MLSKLNKFLNSSIIISIAMLFLGIIFMILPDVSFNMITYILAVMLIANGIYFIIEKENSFLLFNFLTLGIVEFLLGIVLLIKPELVKTLFPIVVGIVMITKSTTDLRISLMLKRYNYNNWLSIFLLSIISIICGFIIIMNPSIGSLALTFSLGLIISIYSVSNLIDTIIFKKNINTIVKTLEK